MRTPHAFQAGDPLADEIIIPDGLRSLPGPFVMMALADLAASWPTRSPIPILTVTAFEGMEMDVCDLGPIEAGLILVPLDLGTLDGWRRLWRWEWRLRRYGDLRGVRLLIWWH